MGPDLSASYWRYSYASGLNPLRFSAYVGVTTAGRSATTRPVRMTPSRLAGSIAW